MSLWGQRESLQVTLSHFPKSDFRDFNGNFNMQKSLWSCARNPVQWIKWLVARPGLLVRDRRGCSAFSAGSLPKPSPRTLGFSPTLRLEWDFAIFLATPLKILGLTALSAMGWAGEKQEIKGLLS